MPAAFYLHFYRAGEESNHEELNDLREDAKVDRDRGHFSVPRRHDESAQKMCLYKKSEYLVRTGSPNDEIAHVILSSLGLEDKLVVRTGSPADAHLAHKP